VHPNAQLITDFYSAFQRKDGAAMAACYAPNARFSDPVFPALDARQAGAMWRMFCERPDSDLRVEFDGVEADDERGRAHWVARYTFPPTGRSVVNSIDAELELANGKIVRHQDRFDFWKWARMALGPVGVALGWSPLVRNKVRRQARSQLERFMRENSI
jgi:ketosteroid isomerase-like protein